MGTGWEAGPDMLWMSVLALECGGRKFKGVLSYLTRSRPDSEREKKEERQPRRRAKLTGFSALTRTALPVESYTSTVIFMFS